MVTQHHNHQVMQQLLLHNAFWLLLGGSHLVVCAVMCWYTLVTRKGAFAGSRLGAVS